MITNKTTIHFRFRTTTIFHDIILLHSNRTIRKRIYTHTKNTLYHFQHWNQKNTISYSQTISVLIKNQPIHTNNYPINHLKNHWTHQTIMSIPLLNRIINN